MPYCVIHAASADGRFGKKSTTATVLTAEQRLKQNEVRNWFLFIFSQLDVHTNFSKFKESKGIRFSKCFKKSKNLSSIQNLNID